MGNNNNKLGLSAGQQQGFQKSRRRRRTRRQAVAFESDTLSSGEHQQKATFAVAGPRPKRGILKFLTHNDSTRESYYTRTSSSTLNTSLGSLRSSPSDRGVMVKSENSLMSLHDSSSSMPFSNLFSRKVTFVDSPSSLSSASLRRKMVRFGTVESRQYDTVVDDNPACENGPSVGLGWDYCDDTDAEAAAETSSPISVHMYERNRPPRSRRRGTKMLQLTPETRFEMLKEAGIPAEEVEAAIKSANTIKQRRKETSAMMFAAPAHETLEKWVHRLKRTVHLKQSDSKQISKLWDKAQLQHAQHSVAAAKDRVRKTQRRSHAALTA